MKSITNLRKKLEKAISKSKTSQTDVDDTKLKKAKKAAASRWNERAKFAQEVTQEIIETSKIIVSASTQADEKSKLIIKCCVVAVLIVNLVLMTCYCILKRI